LVGLISIDPSIGIDGLPEPELDPEMALPPPPPPPPHAARSNSTAANGHLDIRLNIKFISPPQQCHVDITNTETVLK
jgi:hypothetical protein